jgi:hypothetical protein
MQLIKYCNKTYKVVPTRGAGCFGCSCCKEPVATCVPNQLFDCRAGGRHAGMILVELDPLYAALLKVKEADDGKRKNKR